jgi:predicted RNase H-like HicB family nuclease
MQMSEITFRIHHAEEGGFWAEAEGWAIFTQGETLDELEANIREAVACYFGGAPQSPEIICWRFIADQLAA